MAPLHGPSSDPVRRLADKLLGESRASTIIRRSEGSLPAGADHPAPPLYAVGPQGPDHDAVMRIGGEAPGRRAHSQERCNTMVGFGGRPPGIVIGDPRYPVR